MSRKDYELIARTIHIQWKNANHSNNPDADVAATARLARDIATALVSDNHRFNRQKFLAACGMF